MSELDGIGYRMPVTMGAFTVGALGLIGLPPFAALWSKWYLVTGADDGGHIAVIAVLLGSSLLNALYLPADRPSAPSSLPRARAPAWRPGGPRRPGRSWRRPWWRRLGTAALFFYPQALLTLVQPLAETP